MESKAEDKGTSAHFLRKNWVMVMWLIGGVFALGGIFTEFQHLQSQRDSDKIELQAEIDDLSQRQEKKITVQNGLLESVSVLEKHHAWEEGYNQAVKDFENKK